MLREVDADKLDSLLTAVVLTLGQLPPDHMLALAFKSLVNESPAWYGTSVGSGK